MHFNFMKTQNTSIRAGVISLLVFAICYLWVTGISDLPRACLFIVSFAVCFVLMMQSVTDLLVSAFNLAARFSGAGVGCSVKFVRRAFSHNTTSA
jgi:hypothetical protein